MTRPDFHADALGAFLRDLRSHAEQLGPAATRVASVFEDQITRLPDMTITEIAAAASVSEPTVGRVCQMLGFSGYREFRIHLARASGASLGQFRADIKATDKPSDIASKVIEQAVLTLQRVREQLHPQRISDAVALLSNPARIEIYGHGNSGIVAQDAQHKFFRLGIPSIVYSDSHVHAMSAALLSARDAVLCISRSGQTTELVRTAEILRERSVPMVAITPDRTALAKLASVNLHVDFDEDPDVFTPMSSRLGQLTIVDILAVSVAVQRGALSSSGMARAREALREKRL